MDISQIFNIITSCLLLSTILKKEHFNYVSLKTQYIVSNVVRQMNDLDDESENDSETAVETSQTDAVAPKDGEVVPEDGEVVQEDGEVVQEDEETSEREYDQALPQSMLMGIAIKGFLLYTNALHRFYKYCDALYTYHPTSKEAIDIACYFARCIHGYYLDYRVEPYCANWVCVLSHHHALQTEIANIYYPIVPSNTTILNEKYENVYLDANPITSMGSISRSIRQIVPSIVYSLNKPKLIDGLLLCKYNDRYISRIFTRKTDMNFIVDVNQPRSRVSFLSIEYTHPSLSSTIVIELPRSMFYTGNEILSSAFVKRVLEYNVPHHVMNEDYTVVVMDNMLQTIKLGIHDYILLNERAYKVCSL